MATFAILIHDFDNPMGDELSSALIHDVDYDEACLFGALLARIRHPMIIADVAIVDMTGGDE